MRSIFRRLGQRQWVVMALLGLLLAVTALPVSRSKPTPSEERETKTELEQKLEILLSSAEGVGETRVLIMTGEEQRPGEFYGRETEAVTGVLIAAQGADDLTAVQNIKEAVMALFQLEAHKIKVMKMK